MALPTIWDGRVRPEGFRQAPSTVPHSGDGVFKILSVLPSIRSTLLVSPRRLHTGIRFLAKIPTETKSSRVPCDGPTLWDVSFRAGFNPPSISPLSRSQPSMPGPTPLLPAPLTTF